MPGFYCEGDRQKNTLNRSRREAISLLKQPVRQVI